MVINIRWAFPSAILTSVLAGVTFVGKTIVCLSSLLIFSISWTKLHIPMMGMGMGIGAGKLARIEMGEEMRLEMMMGIGMGMGMMWRW